MALTEQAAVDIPRCADEVRTVLEMMGDMHAYHRWLFDTAQPYLHGRICEVGGGTGNITQYLLGYERVTVIEPEPLSRETIVGRFSGRPNLTVVGTSLERCPCQEVPADSFDSLLSVNVLEHIEDDVAAAQTMADLVRPGGHVVAIVPAMQSLFGELDLAAGHYRRYSRRLLASVFNQAGLNVVRTRYFNTIGTLGWLVNSRVRGRSRMSQEYYQRCERAVPLVRMLDYLCPLPFGQSLLIVGQRPER
jgi:SAM-dependent methyltransferase